MKEIFIRVLKNLPTDRIQASRSKEATQRKSGITLLNADQAKCEQSQKKKPTVNATSSTSTSTSTSTNVTVTGSKGLKSNPNPNPNPNR